jgi:hypothetical protein
VAVVVVAGVAGVDVDDGGLAAAVADDVAW